MIEKEITIEELDAIYRFINNALHVYEFAGYQKKDLIICMPWWLKLTFRNYNENQQFYSFHNHKEPTTSLMFDVTTNSHYKDEVVVFIENSHNWTTTGSHYVHEIKLANK